MYVDNQIINMKKLFIPILSVFTLLISVKTLNNNLKSTEVKSSVNHKTKNYQIVKVTTYTIDPRQTDSTPTITASGFNLHPKNPKKHRIVAVSRDIKKKLKFGDKIYLEGTGKYDGVYYVHDVMNKRYKNRIDILINPNDKPTMFRNAKIYIQ